jgi:hypothetical protein
VRVEIALECNAQVVKDHCAIIYMLDGVYDLATDAGTYMIWFQYF